jgi:hypothetical protein
VKLNELTLKLILDTDDFITRCRTIAKHLTDIADKLEMENTKNEKVVREGTD